MNAKVVFIVELNALINMFFYCLLQINNKLPFYDHAFSKTKIETDFKYTTSFRKKSRILTNIISQYPAFLFQSVYL
jgi:hypothetical protein